MINDSNLINEVCENIKNISKDDLDKVIKLANSSFNFNNPIKKRKICKFKTLKSNYIDLSSHYIEVKFNKNKFLCIVNSVDITQHCSGNVELNIKLISSTNRRFYINSSYDLEYKPSKDYEIKVMGRSDDILYESK